MNRLQKLLFGVLTLGVLSFGWRGQAQFSQPNTDATIITSDITTNDVTTAKHGFAPKAPNETGKFLRGDASWTAIRTVINSTSTGTQNDFTPTGFANDCIIRVNNASLLTINGFAPGYDGMHFFIVSIGAGQIDLVHQSGAGSATGNLINFATAGKTSLAPGSGVAEYVYDSTTGRWRLLTHDQGAYITRTYASGNFTASAGTWTVAAGDVQTDAYLLRGRTVTWIFDFEPTTTSAGFGSDMRVAIPGSYTPTKQATTTTRIVDNATTDVGKAIIQIAGTFMILRNRAEAAWTSSVTDLDISAGVISFEVN